MIIKEDKVEDRGMEYSIVNEQIVASEPTHSSLSAFYVDQYLRTVQYFLTILLNYLKLII
jgi:hypothetical protein